MDGKCIVDGCDSQFSADPLHPERVLFFSFPANEQYRDKWREAICFLNGQILPDIISKRTVVCENHFSENVKVQTGNNVHLTRVAVPSLFSNAHQSQWCDDLDNPQHLTIVKCESIDLQEDHDMNDCSTEKPDCLSGGEENKNQTMKTDMIEIEHKNGFPTDSEVAEHWSLILKEFNNQRNSFDIDRNSVICGWHFSPHYKIKCGGKCCLKISAIPTIFGNYTEQQSFLTYNKEYSCEQCGYINSVTTSLKGNLFNGNQLSQPAQGSTVSLNSAQSLVENSMKNDPLASSSQFSYVNLGSNLQVNPVPELSTCDTKAKKRKRIHYPGDVKDDEDLGEETSQKYISVLKKKIVDQRKQTKTLTQRNRRYEKKISTLKSLLKELMEKTMSKQHAVES